LDEVRLALYKVCKLCVYANIERRRLRKIQEKIQEKICIICNGKFRTSKLNKKTCSEICSKKQNNNLTAKSALKYYYNNKKEILKKQKESYYRVHVAYNFNCSFCKLPFIAYRKNTKYCSQKCWNYDYSEIKKAERRAKKIRETLKFIKAKLESGIS
jgi:hypothetical protein